MIEEADADQRIMYIPVAVDTDGGTPREIISGLKIEPPPRPNAPLTHPPNSAPSRRFLSYLPL